MKPRKKSLIRNASLCACLIVGVVFFTGCKKDISSENPNPTFPDSPVMTSSDSSATISAQAQVAVAYEGFGANAVGGGNSSTVYHVTNLNSSGSGSLANGIGSNKTIVFDVAGTIYSSRLDLGNISYLTIDGSTAPSPGITLDNHTSSGGTGPGGDVISFDGANTHHCILKGIRTTNAGNDGINAVDGAHDIMITNCSSYNNVDGEIDIAGANNVTVQYCIMGASASGGPGCMLITATNVSAHHNLFSPAKANTPGERCPLVHCNYSPVGNPNADIRNNIIWKFGRDNGSGSGYGSAIAYNATGNIINNYYYTAGSSTNNATSISDGYGTGATGKAYMAGNVSGNSGANPNGPSNHAIFPAAAVTTQDACTAASLVLANAGPRPLNSVDQALINAVSLSACGSTPTNQSPSANAGADQTITLPVSSVTLSGSGSDPDGSIASYAWSKVSGTGGTITSASAASTTITGLTAGSYTFKLTVTDNKGATASDNITITVNGSTPTNQSPTANAGADKTITLPTSSVALSGSGSDPDGTIASYAWSKVSGSGGTIASPGAATTNITGLTAGSYTFKLTVTDNKGATASDNVVVTVNGSTPTNQSPTANAGIDKTITLPTSSLTLAGSGSDPDGTIASYLWSKVSGPAGSVSSPNSASTTVTGLTIAGTYVFSLKVTDNKGATATDNVTVTVNSSTQTGGGYGTLTFSELYDASSSVNTSSGPRNTMSSSVYRTGPGSFRSEIRAGDANQRGEMVYSSTSQNPTEGVIEYDVYYENWSSLDGGGHTIEWLPKTSGAGAIVSLQNYGGKFDVVRAIGSSVTHQSGTLMSVSSNTWYKLRWEYKWSTGTDGYVRLFVNDVLYYSYTGKSADGSGQVLRVGQLRWPTSGSSLNTTSVAYYDNLKIYKK